MHPIDLDAQWLLSFKHDLLGVKYPCLYTLLRSDGLDPRCQFVFRVNRVD